MEERLLGMVGGGGYPAYALPCTLWPYYPVVHNLAFPGTSHRQPGQHGDHAANDGDTGLPR